MSNKTPRTYQVENQVLHDLDAVCARFKVGPSDLVNHLLRYGLNKINQSKLTLKTSRAGYDVIDQLGEQK